MASMGLLAYASPGPVHGLAPAWILALWMGFALTFNHSLHYVMRRTWLAIALGAIAGPLSYWIASRTWSTSKFPGAPSMSTATDCLSKSQEE